MCNIAGYVGTRAAAPILIDMLRKQEGLAGGYYTGICTVHEGKFYHAKITGDIETLLKNTDALTLPGTIGIIHSRSNGGGGDEWAHPFIAEDKIAYVANGAQGFFAGEKEKQNKIAASLIEEGHTLLSRSKTQNKKYQSLEDGTIVHMSDVMAHLILKYGSMEEAFCAMPGEIVGLMLDKENADCINFARINYPMNVAFAPHGAYLSSAAVAFPHDCENIQSLPVNTSGKVYAKGFKCVPFKNPPCRVAQIDEAVFEKAFGIVRDALREKEMNNAALVKIIQPVFPKADCVPSAALVYDILKKLENNLILETRYVPGAKENLLAPELWMEIYA